MDRPARTPSGPEQRAPGAAFTQTRWSQVVLAGKRHSPGSHEALEKLCARYWAPVYGFLRHRGKSAHDAEDLTQDFFLHLLESNAFSKVDRSKGRFRSYLLTSLKHFLIDQNRKENALKRGGGKVLPEADFGEAEQRYAEAVDPGLTPEQVYDQQWAAALLAEALQGLRKEFHTAGQHEKFEKLKVFLFDDAGDGAYIPIASELNMTRGAISKAVQRMRLRYQQLVREEVADTIMVTADVDGELLALFR